MKLVAGGRWSIAAAFLFTAYAGSLVWTNYAAQVELRHSALARVELDTEKRAAAITYFFSERRKDVRNLAQSRTVAAFFANQALKMSMEYGLRANLLEIREYFDRVRDENTFGAHNTYWRIALLGTDGEILVDTDEGKTSPTPLLPPEDGDTATIALDPATGAIVAAAPVIFKGNNSGRVLAWVDVKQVHEHFIARPDSFNTVVELLLQGRTPVVSAPRDLTTAMSDLLARAPGEPGAAHSGAITYDDSALAAVTVPIADTPFRLIAMVPTSVLFRQTTPTPFLVAAASVPLIVLLAVLLVQRMRRRHHALRVQIIESDRKRGELQGKNTALEMEVRRRKEVEGRLREQGERLRQQATELQKAIDEAHQLARYDALTGLSNRVLFRESLTRTVANATRNGMHLGVLFLDLDRFKRINDTLGHTVGDELLCEVARRIQNCIRYCDLLGRADRQLDPGCVARQGGDEFTVLLYGLSNPLHAGLIARRIIDSITEPMCLLEHEVVVTASVGISLYPDDGQDLDTLLKNADTAMYSAKEQGRNRYQYYEPSMQKDVMRRLILESDMRRGLEMEQFVVFYQPIFDAHTRSITGVEALLRWRHPTRGMLSPAEFIPIAEESGLIVQLTRFVLERSCADAALWEREQGTSLTVAINLSGRAIDLADIQATVLDALHRSGLAATQLEVELTESMLMERSGNANALIVALKALGVRVSIDDFGTGYSSLSYIKTFAIDTLKVDRSFVRGLPADANGAAIVRAIVAMARTLNLQVVAEGVETQEECDFLLSIGCDRLQGFLLGRPVPAPQIALALPHGASDSRQMIASQSSKRLRPVAFRGKRPVNHVLTPSYGFSDSVAGTVVDLVNADPVFKSLRDRGV
jgi:diguanylate cyclase (GGDEF)-like protein